MPGGWGGSYARAVVYSPPLPSSQMGHRLYGEHNNRPARQVLTYAGPNLGSSLMQEIYIGY